MKWRFPLFQFSASALRNNKRGGTLALVVVLVMVLVMIGGGLYWVNQIMGSHKEIANASDAGAINAAKQALSFPGVTLPSGSISVNGVSFHPQDYAGLTNDNIANAVTLSNINRFVGQAFLVALNARNDSIDVGFHNTQGIKNASAFIDYIEGTGGYGNSLCQQLYLQLVNPNMLASYFKSTAMPNSVRMALNAPTYDPNSDYQVSFLNQSVKGDSQANCLTNIVLPWKQGNSQILPYNAYEAATQNQDSLSSQENGAYPSSLPPNTPPFLEGYNYFSVPNEPPLAGVSVQPLKQPRLASNDDFAREQTAPPSPTGKGILPPNAFQFGALVQAPKGNATEHVLAHSLIGILDAGTATQSTIPAATPAPFQASIPHGYVVVDNTGNYPTVNITGGVTNNATPKVQSIQPNTMDNQLNVFFQNAPYTAPHTLHTAGFDLAQATYTSGGVQKGGGIYYVKTGNNQFQYFFSLANKTQPTNQNASLVGQWAQWNAANPYPGGMGAGHPPLTNGGVDSLWYCGQLTAPLYKCTNPQLATVAQANQYIPAAASCTRCINHTSSAHTAHPSWPALNQGCYELNAFNGAFDNAFKPGWINVTSPAMPAKDLTAAEFAKAMTVTAYGPFPNGNGNPWFFGASTNGSKNLCYQMNPASGQPDPVANPSTVPVVLPGLNTVSGLRNYWRGHMPMQTPTPYGTWPQNIGLVDWPQPKPAQLVYFNPQQPCSAPSFGDQPTNTYSHNVRQCQVTADGTEGGLTVPNSSICSTWFGGNPAMQMNLFDLASINNNINGYERYIVDSSTGSIIKKTSYGPGQNPPAGQRPSDTVQRFLTQRITEMYPDAPTKNASEISQIMNMNLPLGSVYVIYCDLGSDNNMHVYMKPVFVPEGGAMMNGPNQPVPSWVPVAGPDTNVPSWIPAYALASNAGANCGVNGQTLPVADGTSHVFISHWPLVPNMVNTPGEYGIHDQLFVDVTGPNHQGQPTLECFDTAMFTPSSGYNNHLGTVSFTEQVYGVMETWCRN